VYYPKMNLLIVNLCQELVLKFIQNLSESPLSFLKSYYYSLLFISVVPKISDLGETGWVKIIQKYLSPPEVLSLDDDAVDYQLPLKYTIVNVDTWVESTDRPISMDLKSCGYKAVANAVSDVLAKGAFPRHVLTSVNLPGFTPVEDATQIVEGISEACNELNLSYRGGDVNQQSSDISITVTCIGQSDGTPIPRHSDLKIGDEVWWVGTPLGSTGAIFHLLLATGEYERFREKINRYFFRPKLVLEFPEFVKRNRGNIVSSMDCSDGLAKTLYSLLNGTNVSIKLLPQILKVEPWIRKVSNDLVMDFVLFGGEELSIVFITRDIPIEEMRKIGGIKIGEVKESTLKLSLNGINIENRGWQHFKQ